MDTEKKGTDEALWPRIVNGDGEAFGKLFDRHRHRVFGHCLSIVASRQMAQDVVAMVFYEAWQRRADVRIVNGCMVPWLLVTANNTVRHHERLQLRYGTLLGRLPVPGEGVGSCQDYLQPTEFLGEENALRSAFAKLKPKDRDVLTLCVVEGLNSRDAAKVLGLTENAVKSSLRRAESRLENLFSQLRNVHEPVAVPCERNAA